MSATFGFCHEGGKKGPSVGIDSLCKWCKGVQNGYKRTYVDIIGPSKKVKMV